MSPAARWASSSLSRNQLALAAPIFPLMAQCAPATVRAAKIGIWRSATTSCCGDRYELLPVGPGLRPRQVPIGANADAGNHENKDDDRPEPPPVAADALRTAVRKGRLTGERGGATEGPVRRPSEWTSLVRHHRPPTQSSCAMIEQPTPLRANLDGLIAEVHPAAPDGIARRRQCAAAVRLAATGLTAAGLAALACAGALSHPPAGSPR